MKKLTKLFVSLFIVTVLAFSMSACSKKVTVTFDATGGIVSPITCKYQTDKDYSLPTPIRQGYTFVKWQYGEQDIAMEGVWTIKKNATLKAVWEPITYDIKLSYEDDEGQKTEELTVTYGEDFELKQPTKIGHTFAGWYYDDKIVVDGKWEITGENIVLTAKWEANSYNITFDLKGGYFAEAYKNLKTVVFKYGQTYDLSIYGAYHKTGETKPIWVARGEGWSRGVSESGVWLFTEDVILEASWGEYFPVP